MKVPINLASQPFRRDRAMIAASIAVSVVLVFSLSGLIYLALADRQQLVAISLPARVLAVLKLADVGPHHRLKLAGADMQRIAAQALALDRLHRLLPVSLSLIEGLAAVFGKPFQSREATAR